MQERKKVSFELNFNSYSVFIDRVFTWKLNKKTDVVSRISILF